MLNYCWSALSDLQVCWIDLLHCEHHCSARMLGYIDYWLTISGCTPPTLPSAPGLTCFTPLLINSDWLAGGLSQFVTPSTFRWGKDTGYVHYWLSFCCPACALSLPPPARRTPVDWLQLNSDWLMCRRHWFGLLRILKWFKHSGVCPKLSLDEVLYSSSSPCTFVRCTNPFPTTTRTQLGSEISDGRCTVMQGWWSWTWQWSCMEIHR